jgi:endonuclease III
MKNSKDYARKTQKLYRALARKHGKTRRGGDQEVTDAIVYAVVSSETNEKAAGTAAKRLADHFVDWNDLRVARTEEIVEVLQKDTRATRSIASTLTEVLNSVFNQHHAVSLEALKKAGKRPARQALEKIEGISRFVVDYCMLTSLKGHAIPLTGKMIEYLRGHELVDPGADEQQIGGFLAKQIPAKNGYEFYALLRHESETSAKPKRKKATKKVKKKTRTATKKKKTTTTKKVKKKTVKKKTVKKKKTTRRKKA